MFSDEPPGCLVWRPVASFKLSGFSELQPELDVLKGIRTVQKAVQLFQLPKFALLSLKMESEVVSALHSPLYAPLLKKFHVRHLKKDHFHMESFSETFHTRTSRRRRLHVAPCRWDFLSELLATSPALHVHNSFRYSNRINV